MVERPPVGKVIRLLRLELKLTQIEFAKRCGLTSQYLSLLELGKVNVSLDTLLVIAEQLGEPLSHVLSKAEDFELLKRPKSHRGKKSV